jgi:O-antigen/teichoic acid export membrane protein
MFKSMASIGLIQILIILVNMGRSKILSVLLGPSGFGIVATIDQVVLSTVQLAGIAIPFTAMKFMSHAHSESHRRFQAVYSSFLIVLLVLSVAATALMIFLINWQPDLFGDDLVEYNQFFNIAFFGIPIFMLGIFFVHVLAAEQRPASSANLNFLVTLALAVAACIGVWVNGILGLYIATVATGIVTVVFTLIYLKIFRNLKSFSRDASILKELKRNPEIVSMSFTLYLAMSAYSVTMLSLRFFVFAEEGAEGAGLLQALIGITLAFGAISGAMNSLFLTPLVNRSLPLSEKLDAAHDFQKNVILVLLVLILPFILFPKLALTVLFSSEFAIVSQSLFLFLIWQCLYQIVNIYQQLLIGLDDVLFYSISTSLGFFLAILLCPVLVPAIGLMGAAFSLLVGVIFNGALTVYRLKRKFNSDIPFEVWKRIAFCMAMISATVILFYGIEEFSVFGFLIRVFYAAVYVLVIWFILNEEQKSFIYELRRKLPF